MQDFLDLFMTVYNFMKETEILSFTIGDAEVTLTFLNVLIGGAVVSIGISVLHHIMDW